MTFLRTSFSDEWQNPAKWEIIEVEEFEPVFEESSWQGRSIRKLRVLPYGFEEI